MKAEALETSVSSVRRHRSRHGSRGGMCAGPGSQCPRSAGSYHGASGSRSPDCGPSSQSRGDHGSMVAHDRCSPEIHERRSSTTTTPKNTKGNKVEFV